MSFKLSRSVPPPRQSKRSVREQDGFQLILDEEWATKARFQYCDLAQNDGGYRHCYHP
jgi:hypothetical protein